MADEFYREEIIFDVNDADAIRRVNNAENRIKKTFDRTQKRAKALSRVKSTPSIAVKDRMTSTVKRADKLVKKLGKEKASPVLAAKDYITNTINRIHTMMKKLTRSKANPEIRLRDRVTNVLKRIQDGLRKVSSKSWELVIAAKNKTFAVFRSIRNGLTSIQGMATIFITFVGLNKLKDLTIGAAMRFEQYEVAMTHWLDGNTKKAKELTKWMGEFADSTPFNSDDLFPALTRAVGISETTEQAKNLLQVAADMAALTPGKTVQDAMEALADAQMGEFERMKEFQVKMTQEQFKAIGGWSGFIDLVQKRVAGGAEKISATSIGLISTINGYIKSHFRELGNGMLEALKPRLQTISDWFRNNSKTVKKWKDNLVILGRDGADAFLRVLERMFKKINNLFRNPEFQNASFFGKIKIAWNELIAEPFADWYNSTGKAKIKEVSNTIGENIGGFIAAGLMTLFGAGNEGGNEFVDAGATGASSFLQGFKDNFDLEKVIKAGADSLYNVNRNMFEGPGEFIGAMLADIIVLSLVASMGKKLKNIANMLGLSWLFKKGKGMLTGGDNSKGGGMFGWFKNKNNKGPNPLPTDDLLPPRSTVHKASKLTKFFKSLTKFVGKIGGKVPYIGPLLAGLSLVTASDEERPGAIGGIGGGLAGAGIGAAIGSVVPGIGTAIGGLIGGLLGSFGGEWIGDNWDGVKNFFGGLVDLRDSLLNKLFSREWWTEQWNRVKGFASDFLSGRWIASGIGYIRGYIENTLLSGEWWQEQWDEVIETGKSVWGKIVEWWNGEWDSFKSFLNNAKTIISDILINKEWWLEQFGKVISWATIKWNDFTTVLEGVKVIINSNLFDLDWWGEKWDKIVAQAKNKLAGIVIHGGLDIYRSFTEGRDKGKVDAKHANGGLITRPHVGLVGEAGPEMIIPLSTNRRNRAMELYEKTGRALGMRPYANGGQVGGYQAPVYDGGDTSIGGINLNFELEGLIGQIILQNKDDLDGKVDEIAAVIAAKLKAILENLI